MRKSHQHLTEAEIFGVARTISSIEKRNEYLEKVCLGSPQTRQAVEELLAIYDREQSFLESPPPELCRTSWHSFPTDSPGAMIGPYKILEVIGEGGMGNVYMAEQVEPVHRQVALKVIKSGMDSKSVIARFEAERQALALMDHPNIAKFYDAGISDAGSPFFVMELVKGRPVNQFCQQHKLDLGAKLDLFTQVCRGVQHAHQKGIIHRDLKPSNVLVALYDDLPVVKVIDFGVAKAVGEKLTDKTMFTRFGQLVGTLEYMSPEQAQLNQLDVDTRSDIYSLGAILYELLVGVPPFEKERLSSAALDEVLRIIREDEPSKPSKRLSSLSTVGLQDSPAGSRYISKNGFAIPADLDWIVMKCLEKDRSRRYETTNGLAKDISRYLDNEPVLAGPPTLGYKLKKLFRRNQIAVSVTGIVLATLVAGAAISTWQAVRAYRAERVAIDYLTEANDEKRHVEELNLQLSHTIDSLEREKSKSDWHLARVKFQVEEGVSERVSILEEVIPVLEMQIGNDADLVLELKSKLAICLALQGNSLAAFELAQEILALSEASHGPLAPSTIVALHQAAALAMSVNEYDVALNLRREKLDRVTQIHGTDSDEFVYALDQLGEALYRTKNFQEAILAFQQVQEFWHRRLGRSRGRDFTREEALNYFGSIGLEAYVIPGQVNSLNPTANYLTSYLDLAASLQNVGRYQDVAEILKSIGPVANKARAIVRRMGGDLAGVNNIQSAILLRQAAVMDDLESAKEAMILLERSVSNERDSIQARDEAALLLGDAYIFQKKFDKAEEIFVILVACERELDKPDLGWGNILGKLGYCQWRLNKLDLAEQTLANASARSEGESTASKFYSSLAKSHLGGAYLSKGQTKKGAELLVSGCQEILASNYEIRPRDRPYVKECLSQVAGFYENQGDTENAERWQATLLVFNEQSASIQ